MGIDLQFPKSSHVIWAPLTFLVTTYKNSTWYTLDTHLEIDSPSWKSYSFFAYHFAWFSNQLKATVSTLGFSWNLNRNSFMRQPPKSQFLNRSGNYWLCKSTFKQKVTKNAKISQLGLLFGSFMGATTKLENIVYCIFISLKGLFSYNSLLIQALKKHYANCKNYYDSSSWKLRLILILWKLCLIFHQYFS